MAFKLKLPKLRNPFQSPVGLKKLHAKYFGSTKTRRRWFTWRGLGKLALYGLGIFVLFVVLLFAWYSKDLPTPGKIKNITADASTRLFDRNGEPLYTISGEKKRIIIDKAEIPDVVKNATIALEDKNFYKHIGVDPRGLARAFLFGGSRGGGSTITQQYVKNALLTNKRSIDRKIKEAILAVQLELLFSKEDILTMYLNEIPYGGNNYGIEAAARSFFGKSAKDLTLAEAATLAALPQSPSSLSPYGQNTDRLLTRRDLDLQLMADQGYITQELADGAKKEVMAFKPRSESITAPHFVLYVKEWLVKYFEEELGDKQLAEFKVEAGGLVVTTTLDLPKQRIAEGVINDAKKALTGYGASNAGAVVIDQSKGDIIAMVGSVDYYQEQFGAFNITTAKRQPGSSFKPIVYAAAFKEKYSPSSILFDLRTDFNNYTPENYDGRFRGAISIRDALGQSLNIPAVKTLALIGLDKALATASDLGITTLTDKDRYGLSLVLGGGEVMPLEMATAYGVFGNNGVLVPTKPILKITDSNGKVILDRTENKDAKQVLDPQVAYEITDVLADVNAKRPVFGRAVTYLSLKKQVSATKTGTTNQYRDAWTVGYTPYFTTAVWAGNNDNTSMNAAGGAIAAAPIWDGIMEKLHESLEVKSFTKPDGLQEIEVDRLSNKLPVEGSEVIKAMFARWQVPTEKDDVHQRVRVCRENGLLAGDSIPDELTEIRTFRYVKSERPNDPNWENPVRAWAEANGYNQKPPTGNCSYDSSSAPVVSITSPTAGATFTTGDIAITANASAPSGIASVDFSIDGAVISSDLAAPYGATYPVSSLSTGNHQITAIARAVSGATSSTQLTFTVSKDVTAPANVTNFTGIAGLAKATLSWVNPADTDLSLVRIYVYVDSTNSLVRTVDVTKPSSTVVITSLTSGTAYRFTAKSVDTSGNESTGQSIILTPL